MNHVNYNEIAFEFGSWMHRKITPLIDASHCQPILTRSFHGPLVRTGYSSPCSLAHVATQLRSESSHSARRSKCQPIMIFDTMINQQINTWELNVFYWHKKDTLPFNVVQLESKPWHFHNRAVRRWPLRHHLSEGRVTPKMIEAKTQKVMYFWFVVVLFFNISWIHPLLIVSSDQHDTLSSLTAHVLIVMDQLQKEGSRVEHYNFLYFSVTNIRSTTWKTFFDSPESSQ